MQTDFSDPSTDIPDFPGLDSDGAAGGPSLDTEETSEHHAPSGTYRAFLISGCLKSVSNARTVIGVVGTGDPENRLKAYDNCRSNAWFVRHNVSGKIRVASSRCGLRWCPLCIKTKRFAIVQNVAAWMTPIVQPKFLTLTLKHSDSPLESQIDNLYKFFKELKRRPWFKKRVFGGVWFFQVKQSKTDFKWHPHLHILFQGRFIEHEKISQIWSQITHGSTIVDIRAVGNRKKAVEYVARYAAAPCDLNELPHNKAVEVASALHNRRICGSFGTAKIVKFTPKPPEDAADWIKLGNFSDIMRGSALNSFDEEIVNCWKSGQTCNVLPPNIPPPETKSEIITPDDVITYEQLLLEFYEGK
jgi:hypothetical protein